MSPPLSSTSAGARKLLPFLRSEGQLPDLLRVPQRSESQGASAFLPSQFSSLEEALLPQGQPSPAGE